MKTVELPIGKLQAHTQNARTHDLAVIKESLQRFGQYRAIVVQAEPHVGKHTGRKLIRRVSRIVTLPDYQGVGIGMALLEVTAAMHKALDYRPRIATSHPAMMASLNRSRRWAMVAAPQRSTLDHSMDHAHAHLNVKRATRRLVASFEYVGDAMDAPDARRLRECHARLEQPA